VVREAEAVRPQEQGAMAWEDQHHSPTGTVENVIDGESGIVVRT
jgi:hypothetical protein